ncbi:MAG TPA: hypothetical protein VGB63_09750 [Pedobacter sp.]|jgi:hypothetical protein
MKLLLAVLLLVCIENSFSQIKVSHSVPQEFKLIDKKTENATYTTENADYFILKNMNMSVNFGQRIVVADKSGKITAAKELKFNPGTFNNSLEIISMGVVKNTLAAFVTNHNKGEGKNTLSIRTIDEKGDFSSTDISVGQIPFLKLTNPGDWYINVTPDKKHVAVVGQLPHEKNKADQFVYYFLDENFKQISTGQFSFPSVLQNIGITELLASDKGDFHLLSQEYDKSYLYPVIYQAKINSTETNIVPVKIEDPGLKNIGYKSVMNTKGEVVLAGYTQAKKTLSSGNSISGTWNFNSSKPAEVKTEPFEKPIENLVPSSLLLNGNTYYLIGEQYTKSRETPTSQQVLAREENFNFTYGDIVVIAFDEGGLKKFQIPLSRNLSARNVYQDLAIATGILNNKLTLIYNDQYNKYVNSGNEYKYVKLPVATSITNDGLMEQPSAYSKEFDVLNTSYKLYPLFNSTSNNRMVLLSADDSNIKAAVFK